MTERPTVAPLRPRLRKAGTAVCRGDTEKGRETKPINVYVGFMQRDRQDRASSGETESEPA